MSVLNELTVSVGDRHQKNNYKGPERCATKVVTADLLSKN